MPFKSEAQRRFMYAKHPKLAKRFQEETPPGKKLPEHVKTAALLATVRALPEAVGSSRMLAGVALLGALGLHGKTKRQKQQRQPRG